MLTNYIDHFKFMLKSNETGHFQMVFRNIQK